MSVRTLDGDGFTLRLVEPDDFPAILRVMQDPTVERWWGKYDMGKVVAEYGDDENETVAYIIEVDGAVAGLTQYAITDEPVSTPRRNRADDGLFREKELVGFCAGTQPDSTVSMCRPSSGSSPNPRGAEVAARSGARTRTTRRHWISTKLDPGSLLDSGHFVCIGEELSEERW